MIQTLGLHSWPCPTNGIEYARLWLKRALSVNFTRFVNASHCNSCDMCSLQHNMVMQAKRPHWLPLEFISSKIIMIIIILIIWFKSNITCKTLKPEQKKPSFREQGNSRQPLKHPTCTHHQQLGLQAFKFYSQLSNCKRFDQ